MKPFVSFNRLNSVLWGELIILLHREIFSSCNYRHPNRCR